MFFKRKKTKTLSEKDLAHALMQVPHPELGKDVVSLGLAKNAKIEGGKVSFELELPNPKVAYKDELVQRCREAVEQKGATQVKIRVTGKPTAPPPNTSRGPVPGVSKILAVASGKGGVGKSTISVQLALALARSGHKVALLDCDIYGPSLPQFAGMDEKPDLAPGQRIQPLLWEDMAIMSMGFLIPRDRALAWRGPMTHKMIQQFLFQVDWGHRDVLVLDLPPGTGDVQLSLTQLTRISAGLIVTTPQEVALADARKGVAMFDSVGVPVLGYVENMSYYLCGSCEKRHFIFGEGGGKTLAEETGKPLLAQIPLDIRMRSHQTSPDAQPFEHFDALADQVYTALEALSPVNRPGGDPGPGWATPSAGAFEV